MSKKSGGGLGLNKLSFWMLGITAIIELVVMLLSVLHLGAGILPWIEAIAIAIMVCEIAVLAWRYVRNASIAWKLLYFIFLIVVLACVVVPRVL